MNEEMNARTPSLLEGQWTPEEDSNTSPGPEASLAAFQVLICDHLRSVEKDDNRKQKRPPTLPLVNSR